MQIDRNWAGDQGVVERVGAAAAADRAEAVGGVGELELVVERAADEVLDPREGEQPVDVARLRAG